MHAPTSKTAAWLLAAALLPGAPPLWAAHVVGRIAAPARVGAAGEPAGSTPLEPLDAIDREALAWIPVTLVVPPGEHAVSARAHLEGPGGGPLAAECLGTTGFCGYQVALVRVAKPHAGAEAGTGPGSPGSDAIVVEAETAPGDVAPVARLRPDPDQERRTRVRLRSLVANPADVEACAPLGTRVRAGDGPAKQGGFRPAGDPSLAGSGVRYLIVTSAALAPTFQQLADWKTERGMPATVRTIEWIESRTRRGIDRAETLRNFLIEAYALWGVEYVLLAGDTGILPARFGWSSIYGGGTSPTDLYFSCLDGTWNADGDAVWGEGSLTLDPSESDIFPELAVGRAPVNDATEALTFVNKTIAYEKPLFTDYQTRAMFMAEVLIPANWDSGMTVSYNGAVGTEQMITESLPASMTAERLYDTYWQYPGALPLSRGASLASMNAGPVLVNQLGHGFRYTMSAGDASIVNSDADALGNGGRSFLLVMANCAAVAFDYNCLAERFLLNPGGGAAAVVGAARSVSASLIVTYNRAFYRQLFELGHVHLADALNEMRLERAALAELDGSDRWIQFSLNALGDPEMTLFSGPVRFAALAHADSVAPAPDTLQVSVQADSLPVAGAQLCAQKGDEVYAVGWTDSLGNAALAIAPETPGPLYLTVSGSNLATHTDTLIVSPSASPVLVVGGRVVDDDSLPPSAGNGDGWIDAGETIELALQVFNQGGSAADSVTGTLQSPDPRVTILQAALEVGSVGAGQLVPGVPPLVVRLDAGVPDGTEFDLDLHLQDRIGGSWNDRVRLLVCAPHPEVTRVEVTPVGGAPGVQSLAATARIAVTVKNFGSGQQPALAGVLTAADSTVIVVRDSIQFGPILPLAEVVGAPEFEIADTTAALSAPLALRLEDAAGRALTVGVDLVPPPAPALPTADLAAGPGTLRLTWPVAGVPDLLGYHVFRTPAGGGVFERLTPDVVHHADYYDRTVLPNTHYDYQIVTVDSSLQWSAPSPTLPVNTTAAPVPPWPLDLSDATASSVGVGDLDGDTTQEVVIGDVGLYAWHANGQEVVDGDSIGTTYGVFSMDPGAVSASVALAEIDSLPGLEIVGASWLTNRLYIWNGRGAILPGWPVQPANGGNTGYWASPAVGDIDADGSPEIVAVSKDGYLYAWHADGTSLVPGADGRVRLVGAWTQASPALADLDGDGKLEIVVSGALAKVYVQRFDGTDFPGWPRDLYALGKGSPAIGDVDDDGDLEIVITSESDHIWVFASDGTTLPGWPKVAPQDAPDLGPSPALGDLDGDGRLEIVVVAVNRTWALSKLYVYDATGIVILNKSLELNSQSSPILADIDGEGGIDIVHGGEAGVLHAWDISGQELAGFPIPLGDYIRGTPQYCDLDRDGMGDLVLAGWDKKVHAWRMRGPYRTDRAPWPMFHGNLARTGFLPPSFPTAAGDPPPARRLLAAWSPNPFNPSVVLRLVVPEPGPGQPAADLVQVEVDLFDARGRRVRRLLEARRPPGAYRLVWDGRDDGGRALGSGVYFYRARAAAQTVAGKLTLVR